ncbi:pyridoxal phosphate-dependent enzyme, D-cysteine desulfhydrase family [Alkaliphilus metalliredigens QYMF]|uniref:Pyridoxal phosphate-dependent enzyme, D-cysteine desulfhydrase family n=1 Tax=Alkaliphilus metalliredigens (strain QYMF) TaxID=293826 RepID=A6TKV1_ALKMQ|nr:D-cysteine desulfhydrase family protein [Alkaliphilus metalliredigens]ABR46819.1 pyridoxal phosphate-dependent enzyme, D-cysteine desulfhydrase family [Alkaliphilus metalliredigens QYMF]
MTIPKSLKLANLPTKIEKLERLSKSLGDINIYIKRDDQTGTEVSGNKVRKLEFAVQEALDQGCDYLITCGGIQSNHARATAAVAAKLDINSYLVLRSNGDDPVEGNYFLNKILGAEICLITPEEYRDNRMKVMEEIQRELAGQGHKAYILPEGASNGIGTFGYYQAMEEILEQEAELDVKFDAIVTAVGSGGTYAGLFYANKLRKNEAKIYGINVCDDADHFKNRVQELVHESIQYTKRPIHFKKEDIHMIDGYVGEGYAQSRQEELTFILDFAKLEGIILDPVYTGKAMYGLVEEIKKGSFNGFKNILFIHTGGLYGLFPKGNQLF